MAICAHSSVMSWSSSFSCASVNRANRPRTRLWSAVSNISASMAGHLPAPAARNPPLAFASMCGRFVAASSPDDIANYFDAQAPEALLEPNYNVAPTHDVYAVRADGGVRRVGGPAHGPLPAEGQQA